MSHAPTPRERRDAAMNLLLARRSRCRSAARRSRLTRDVVELNLGLSDALAHRYNHRGVELDDLIQVGRYALVLAVQRYDPTRHHGFAAFAVPTILGELRRHFRDSAWTVRPPRRMVDLRARIRVTEAELEQRGGRRPRRSAVATELGETEHAVDEALLVDGAFRPVSLERPGAPCGPAASDPSERLVDHLALAEAMAVLTDRERAILAWRFVEECTQSEIAARLGVSQMQVSRLLARVLSRLRAELGDAAAA